MRTSPIILLSSERSGTNLLRAMMSSHSMVASPPPCGMMPILAPHTYKYLPPLRASHIDSLIADAVLLTQTHLNKWDVDWDVAEIRNRMVTPSFWGVFRALNDIYAERHGRICWFSKEPDIYRHVYEIALHLPDARFVYLVRDGRDVAASMLKGGLHEQHIYYAALRWSENQRVCMNALSDPLLRDRIFMLKYEELVAQPESQLKLLMEFIDLPFEAAQLEFYRSAEIVQHAKKNTFWENLANPVDATNTGKYRQFLTPGDIAIFEGLAWREMRTLGYPLENAEHQPLAAWQRALFKVQAYLRRRKVMRAGGKTMEGYRQRQVALQPVIERFFDE